MVDLANLTIIVPTKNESHNISAFLQSLPKDVSVIAVDSSDDDTCDIIAESRPCNTKIIRQMCNISAARQIGGEAATTPWLLYTDADIAFPLNYFTSLDLQSDAGAIYGPKLSQGDYARYYHLIARGQKISHRFGIPAATGSNMLVLRQALIDAGGFDVDLPCNEDSELVWRIARSGYQTIFDDQMIVYATDHRRLEKGTVSKTQHSLARCFLMYFDLMPDRWRYKDWGYWRS